MDGFVILLIIYLVESIIINQISGVGVGCNIRDTRK